MGVDERQGVVMPMLAIHPLVAFPVAWGTCANLSFGADIHGGGQIGVYARGEGWEELQDMLGSASGPSPS